MDSLLYFKAASFSLITLCAVTGLVVLLISARRERDSSPPIRGAVMLTFLLAGLCAALALLFAYQIQKRTSDIFRLETVKYHFTLAARSL
jgi:ABC-type Fe3+ transport system permease subunit